MEIFDDWQFVVIPILVVIFAIYGFVQFVKKIWRKIFRKKSIEPKDQSLQLIPTRLRDPNDITYRQELFILKLCDELGIEEVDQVAYKLHKKYLQNLRKEEASEVIEFLLDIKDEDEEEDYEEDE